MYVCIVCIYMSNYQWYLTEKRKNLLTEIEKLPDYGRKSHAEILEIALEEFYKVHGKGNPMYKLETWSENPEFIAIPALLAEKEKRDKWIELQAKNKRQEKKSKTTLQTAPGIFCIIGMWFKGCAKLITQWPCFAVSLFLLYQCGFCLSPKV